MAAFGVIGNTSVAPISSILNSPSPRPATLFSPPAAQHPSQAVHRPKRVPEDGRTYDERTFHVYPMPSDDNERDRMDAMHYAWYTVALEGRLHIATLRPGRLRILDIGYGTGIWAFDMEAHYPHAEIIAIDIRAQQPPNDANHPNVQFRSGVDFTSEDWGLELGSFDFVHCAMLCGSVPDWQTFVHQVARHLRPGGQAEFLELDWTPRCDDERVLAANPNVWHWWSLLQQAYSLAGKPITYPENLESLLRNVGCPVTNHKTMEFYAWEDNSVPRANDDEDLPRPADWFRFLLSEPRHKTLQTTSMGLFVGLLDWQPAQVTQICNEVESAFTADRSLMYMKWHVVTAQKR